MKLGLRVFLGYFLALGLTAWLSLTWIERELRPLVRQASEEALVETAHALAASVEPLLDAHAMPQASLANALQALPNQPVQAAIWGIDKQRLNLHITITDNRGIVTFDSLGADVGKDFSRWNDIYLTLQGQYGVRSTRSDPADEASTVMHVAAPIRRNAQLIGVLSVALPGHSTQAYLQLARTHLHFYGITIMLGSLLVGALFTGWLIANLRRIGNYAEHAGDRHTALPKFAKGTELEKLTSAIDHMRNELEGRHYLEQYVHHLTHELKSPLSAIRASNELLADSDMPAAQRARFVANVERQCERLQTLTDNLLQLVRLEQQRTLAHSENVALLPLIEQECQAMQTQADKRHLRITLQNAEPLSVTGDPLLIALALRNLLQNALQFADEHSDIRIALTRELQHAVIRIHNRGPAIPDYACARLGERFYSLPHPDGSKGTGLGLAFVREIAALHHGHCTIANSESGVCATLSLPA